jgi:hypothetical protein
MKRKKWRAFARTIGFGHTNGAILWEGASEIDGAPIVLIVTGLKRVSKNNKTDDMLQTWILRQDIAPHEAAKSGEDVSICGDCAHRPATIEETGETRCYVQLHKAPLSVWTAYKAGSYPRVTAEQIPEGFDWRMGSYGDPAAMPADVWVPFLARAKGRTGYTHRWQQPSVRMDPRWALWLMASVDSTLEMFRARRFGFRTFRVGDEDSVPLKGEKACPAAFEAGQLLSCAACKQCDGTERGAARPGRHINRHGPGVRKEKTSPPTRARKISLGA